jgi:flagellin
MSLKLANNVSALTAQHNLGKSSSAMNKSLERLSSGLKINRGADGPAALVISEKQRAQIAGLQTAIDNTEKGVSVVQTAEGALNEINSLLVKIRGLALDSANTGVNDVDALAANQAEIDNALDTIDRIANNTQFGTKKLLDGSAGLTGVTTDASVTYLSASSENSAAGSYLVNVSSAAERAEVIATTAQGATTLAQDEILTVNGVNITLSSGLDRAGVQSRINEFSGQTGVVAEDDDTTATATRLRTEDFGSDAAISVVSNQSGANSAGFTTAIETDTGADIAGTIGGNAASGSGNVLTGTAGGTNGVQVQFAEAADAQVSASGALGSVTITDNALTFQIGANQNQTVDIAIDRVNPTSLGLGVSNNQFTNLNDINVTSASKSQDTLGVVDAAIDEITNLRGELGAFQQNTLESTANNLRATLENTVNAESIIRDTDFAEEISNFTKYQTLVQAGTNVLGNANQSSQLVLSLLG